MFGTRPWYATPGAPGLRRAPARESAKCWPRAGRTRTSSSRRPAGRTRSPPGASPRSWGGVTFGSRRVDSRAAWVDCRAGRGVSADRPDRRQGRVVLRRPAVAAAGAAGSGGRAGPGLRRGRRDPDTVRPGEALDFWRVEAVEPDRLLRLAAEMRLPGRAWLQFEVTPENGGSLIRQTALFDPVGAGWAGVLVCAVGDSPGGVRRHAAQHRPGGNGAARIRAVCRGAAHLNVIPRERSDRGTLPGDGSSHPLARSLAALGMTGSSRARRRIGYGTRSMSK